MSKEMKFIMENWRRNVHEGAIRDGFKRFFGMTPDKFDQPADFAEVTTAYEYFAKIQAIISALALYQHEQFREEALKELGADVIDMGLDALKVTPGLGNLLSAATTTLKAAKSIEHGVQLMAKSKEVQAGIAKMTKGLAGEYVNIDDDKLSKHPLAIIFNVDDRMSAPLKKEEMENFANWFLAFMYNNPQDPVGDAMKYADNKLAQYLKTKRQWQDVKPPNE